MTRLGQGEGLNLRFSANVAFSMRDNIVTGLAVIGNGPGAWPPIGSGIPFIRFNLPINTPLVSGEIRICNRKITGINDYSVPFVIQSSILLPDEHFHLQNSLATSATKLSKMLGCLPSVGLTAVYALQTTGVSLELYRMPLCPSLVRSADMPPRKPLAASFHNWLGERRVAWCLSQKQQPTVHWPDLWLPGEDPAFGNSHHDDPYPALFAWFGNAAGKPDQGNLDLIEYLSGLPMTVWYEHATTRRLQRLEKYFFLPRVRRETENWWLYHNDLSPAVNTLMQKLMRAQQHLATGQSAN